MAEKARELIQMLEEHEALDPGVLEAQRESLRSVTDVLSLFLKAVPANHYSEVTSHLLLGS